MEVKLIQPEIEMAVRLYLVHEEGMKLDGRKLEIEFTAGRNPPTVSAEIKIVKDTAGTADVVTMKSDDLATDPVEVGDDDSPFSDEQTKLPFQEFLS